MVENDAKKMLFSMFFDSKQRFAFCMSVFLVCMLKSIQNAIEICHSCLILKFLLKRETLKVEKLVFLK